MSADWFKGILIITWQSPKGATHTRRVGLGHIRGDEDFHSLAVLNIGGRGRVLSQIVERAP